MGAIDLIMSLAERKIAGKKINKGKEGNSEMDRRFLLTSKYL